MIRINLLPVREAEHALKRRQQLSIVALVTTILLLLMIVPYLYQKRTINHLDKQANELSVELAKLDEQTKEARDLDKMQAELRTKLQVIKDLDAKRVGPAHVLVDLSHAVPEKLWLEEFTETKGVATLVGWALDNQTVADFMRQLSASKYFYNVDLSEATQPENASQQPRSLLNSGAGIRFKRFILKANVDYFGRGGKRNPKDGSRPLAKPSKAKT